MARGIAWLLGDGWKNRLLLWLAISAGAILLQKATSREPTAGVPAEYYEEEEGNE